MSAIGFPDATNTGVPAGVPLTRHDGPLIINTPGAVIEGLDIRGYVVINADNVTLRNCIVTTGDFWGISMGGGGRSTGGTGALIENCTVIGLGNNTNAALVGTGTWLRNDISGFENGMVVDGDNLLAQDNWIHDLQGDGHKDGIAIHGGSIDNITIRHNTISAPSSATAAVFITNDFGSVTNVVVDNNLLSGGQFTVYSSEKSHLPGQINGVQYINNVIDKGNYGYVTVSGNSIVWQGNTDFDTGRTVLQNNTLGDGAVIAGLVSINDVTISEGNSGTKVATFTVTRSGGTAAFDVNFATSNGTATVADSDYVAASNTLHFGANQNTQTISVTINGDTKVEGNEAFNVVLSNATNGATISDSQGVGTITNDDGAVIAGLVSINDVTTSEGNSGTKVATFTVTRSGGTAAFDVNFATSNGTATVADSDYVATSNTLHFAANQNTQTISVTINGDTKVEGNEAFNVVLSNATNGATISDSQGVGTITNDDIAPTADLDGNPLVNDLFYYVHNKDVWDAGVDADAHYDAFGWHEGRDPNAFFDTSAYLAAYSDVAAAGVNPLEHYLVFGWREGRDPSDAFDTDVYLAAYPDVAAAGVNPLEHFLVFGIYEGRSAFSDGIIN